MNGFQFQEKYLQGVDNTGNVTHNGQADVDEQVCTTSTLQKDTYRRQDDGQDDLTNITLKDVSRTIQPNLCCRIRSSLDSYWHSRHNQLLRSDRLTMQ